MPRGFVVLVLHNHHQRPETAGRLPQLLKSIGARLDVSDDTELLQYVLGSNILVGHVGITLHEGKHLQRGEKGDHILKRAPEGAVEGAVPGISSFYQVLSFSSSRVNPQ